MPEHYLLPHVEELQLAKIFQQDGATPHWSNDVQEILDRHFQGRWVDYDRPIAWPQRSSDITPWIFSYWDTSRIMSTKPLFKILLHLETDIWGCTKCCWYDTACSDRSGISSWHEGNWRGTCWGALNVNKTWREVEHFARNHIVLCHVVSKHWVKVMVLRICGPKTIGYLLHLFGMDCKKDL